MSRQPSDERRVLGPYPDEGKFRIRIIDPDRGTYARKFETETEAEKVKDEIEKLWSRLDESNVINAIDAYHRYKLENGNEPKSTSELIRRLKLFFPETVHKKSVAKLTETECSEFYVTFRFGHSVAYHRAALSNAKSFLRWCVENGWMKESPIEKVKGIGKKKKGKLQLTADEAKRFAEAAIKRVEKGDEGALAGWMLLFMALRKSELTKRRVRDIDQNGTVLRIEDAKTESGNRSVLIPECIQPYLAELIKGRKANDLIFPQRDKEEPHGGNWLWYATKRVCEDAGVKRVAPHGLRGTSASLAERAQVASEAVAAFLGHSRVSVTKEHYTKREASDRAAQERTLQVLMGGKK
jgi:integrase